MIRKYVGLLCSFIVLLLGVNCYAGAQQRNDMICGPLSFAGIVLDLTNDSQVTRLLGYGKLRNTQFEAKRYFVDRDLRATLIVTMNIIINNKHRELFTVKRLTIADSIDPFLKTAGQEMPVSKYFNPKEILFGLHLGSAQEDVLKRLGKPKKKINENEWRYSAYCCDAADDITLFFENGHIHKIVLAVPDE